MIVVGVTSLFLETDTSLLCICIFMIYAILHYRTRRQIENHHHTVRIQHINVDSCIERHLPRISLPTLFLHSSISCLFLDDIYSSSFLIYSLHIPVPWQHFIYDCIHSSLHNTVSSSIYLIPLFFHCSHSVSTFDRIRFVCFHSTSTSAVAVVLSAPVVGVTTSHGFTHAFRW